MGIFVGCFTSYEHGHRACDPTLFFQVAESVWTMRNRYVLVTFIASHVSYHDAV